MYRTSENGGVNWSNWNRTAEWDITIDSEGLAGFSYALTEGLILEIYVITCGDSKDESDPSNTVRAILPCSPIQNPPILSAHPSYEDGTVWSRLLSDAFPSGITRFAIWRKETGQREWMSLGLASGQSVRDPLSEPSKSYDYVIAWSDEDGKLYSDFSNLASVTLPSADTQTLFPVIKYAASFIQAAGDYYNYLYLGAGDMRATGFIIQYRINNGSWSDSAAYDYTEASLASYGRYLAFRHGTIPRAGDVWNYRLKNTAIGYITSEWSEVFSIKIPSLLPKLPTPTISLNQYGYGVLIGWQTVSGAVGYKIERKRQGEASFIVISDSIGPEVTRFNDTGTVVDNTYIYRVTARGDNMQYQDSDPAEGTITIQSHIILDPPVIDSVVESGIDIQITISHIDPPNTFQYRVEMSENDGAWRDLFGDYPSSMAVSTFTITVAGSYIMEGGNLRFRVKVVPAQSAEAPNPYSEIASITIPEREWLLRWTGSGWDYCSSVTGGWSSPTIVFSDETVAGNVQTNDLGGGILRLQGTGYFMTGALTSGQTALTSKYSKICMIGTLIKQVDGSYNHAWFGSGHTYTFMSGESIELRSNYYVHAGGEAGAALAGTLTDPVANAVTRGTYAQSTGARVFFRFYNGYADIKGIYAIKI